MNQSGSFSAFQSHDLCSSSEEFTEHSRDKYGGLIPKSFFKETQKDMFYLFIYICDETPPLYWLHSIVSIVRLMQYIGNLLFGGNISFYQSQKAYWLVNFIYILFHFFPPFIRLRISSYLSYSYGIFWILFLIIMIILSKIYKKKGVLPQWIKVAIYFIIFSVGYILHPTAAQSFGVILGNIIQGTNIEPLMQRIVQIAFLAIGILLYQYLIYSVFSSVLLFRPNSLATFFHKSQIQLYIGTCYHTFFIGLGSNLSLIPGNICILIGGAFYIYDFLVIQSNGGFISTIFRNIFDALSFIGCIGCIVRAILGMMYVRINEVYLFFLLVIGMIIYFIVSIVESRIDAHRLIILDMIAEDESNMKLINSLAQYFHIINIGFQNLHFICLNWKLSQLAIEKWPTSIFVYVVFAKFAAIFPEERQKLAWIRYHVIQNKFKNIAAKHLVIEINALFGRRETQFSPLVKHKLAEVEKYTQKVQNKFWQIWNHIIQGNTIDIESKISEAINSIQETEKEFHQLLRQFPICRFVLKAYAAFQQKVCANYQRANEIFDQITLIGNGMSAIADDANTFGLLMYPNLSYWIKTSKTTSQFIFDSQQNDSDDVQKKEDIELINDLKCKIESIKFSGISCFQVSLFWLFLLGFLAPSIIFQVALPSIILNWEQPLNYLYSLAGSSMVFASSNLFGYKFLLENLNISRSIHTYIPDRKFNSCYGGQLKTISIFGHELRRFLFYFQRNSELFSFHSSDPFFDQVRHAYLDESIQLQLLNNTNYPSIEIYTQNMIHKDAYFYMAQTLSNVLLMNFSKGIDWSFSQQEINEPIFNLKLLIDRISFVMSLFLDSINHFCNQMHITLMIVMSCLVVLIPCINILIVFVATREQNRNRDQIFSILISVPKNYVSKIINKFSISKSNLSENRDFPSSRSELNKQEENMIKVFTVASDLSSSSKKANVHMIICTIFYIICNVGMSVLIVMAYDKCLSCIILEAPHIDSFCGMMAYTYSVMLYFFEFIRSTNHTTNVNPYRRTQESLLHILTEIFGNMKKSYVSSRYGSDYLFPYQVFAKSVANMSDYFVCSENQILNPNPNESYACYPIEAMFEIFTFIIESHIRKSYVAHQIFSFRDKNIESVWDMLITFIYSRMFYPSYWSILEGAHEQITSDHSLVMIGVCSLLIISFFVVCADFYFSYLKADEFYFALKLLLHFQPSTLLHVPVTSHVFSGYLASNSNLKLLDSEFFSKIIEMLPEGLIIANHSGSIISMNKSSFNILHLATKFGTINDFLDWDNFSGSARPLLGNNSGLVIANFGAEEFVEISKRIIDETIVFSLRNITQSVRYQNLIDEELKKSDYFLKTVLSPSLVERFLSGEENISFSVSSATILFLNIVSFTPWCESNVVQMVMSTLNQMFMYFDEQLMKELSLYRVKCIGDCYVAAGGIFQNPNDPMIHANEMVQFGIDAIRCVWKINKEKGAALQIRVGINTGDPIVAGVIGIKKPSFEILGSPIVMAQQMEQNGVPMMVHISRSTYDLILANRFNVKERGLISIKTGKAFTYLIDP